MPENIACFSLTCVAFGRVLWDDWRITRPHAAGLKVNLRSRFRRPQRRWEPGTAGWTGSSAGPRRIFAHLGPLRTRRVIAPEGAWWQEPAHVGGL